MYVRFYLTDNMLTKTEKRFLRHWEEQRTGGKLAYIALTTLAGTIMLSLFVFVVLFFGLHVLFSWLVLITVTGVSLLLSVALATIAYNRNEKKYHQLLKQETLPTSENGF